MNDKPFILAPGEVTPITRRHVILTAADLLSGGDPRDAHPEYVRALTEMVTDLTGSREGDKDAVTAMLWALAE